MNKTLTLKTAKIIIGYLALVFALAFLFTSCSTTRDESNCKYYQNKYVGYSFGGFGKGRLRK